MTLRDKAAALEAPRPVGTIDRLLRETEGEVHDEIVDLLTGEPKLSARVVAATLTEAFEPTISAEMVQKWRSR